MDISNHQTTTSSPAITKLVRKALEEDVGAGDITTETLVSEATSIKAVIFSRSNIVVSGTETAETVFSTLDSTINFSVSIKDGCQAKPNEPIAVISGNARAILTGERTALNFMQRMSGIATLTSKFVAKAQPYNMTVLDTRKTTPLLRELEKHAVTCGGGVNHRMGLYDRILIKDNHRKLWTLQGKGDIAEAVAVARRSYPDTLIEVEVESESDFRNVLNARPDWILLDNIPERDLRQYVEICDEKCRLEVSGGINLDNITFIAQSGVDAVSLGCLTHSAPAADLSLEVV